MKLVFCGTPAFAVPTLTQVANAGHEVGLVITQPDRSSGRGLTLTEPAVKSAAKSLGMAVLQPDKIKNNVELRAQLQAFAPDAILIVAYGRIIPKWMLDLPPQGNINLHGSLLPKYRGAAPIQWAIAMGETETGVTTMRIDEGLDTGDMLVRRAVAIEPDATAEELYPKLAEVGAEVMLETLRGLEKGSLRPEAQDHAAATLAPILTREDGLVNFSRDAQTIYNRWRGFQPWPGAHTTLRRKKINILRMRIAAGAAGLELRPGELRATAESLFVGCAVNSAIELLEMQVEGKKKVSGADFARGYQPRLGEMLGTDVS